MLYQVNVGGGDDLLFDDEKILLIAYSETTQEFDNFEYTVGTLVNYFGGTIMELELPELYHNRVQGMITNIIEDEPETSKQVIDFILANSTEKYDA